MENIDNSHEFGGSRGGHSERGHSRAVALLADGSVVGRDRGGWALSGYASYEGNRPVDHVAVAVSRRGPKLSGSGRALANGVAHAREDGERMRRNVCCNRTYAELCGQLGQYIVIPA